MSFLTTIAGAAIPAIAGLLQGRRKPQLQQIPQLTAPQTDLLNQIIAGAIGEGPLSIGGELFQRGFADPLLEQFEERSAPAIRSRFASRGLGGGKLEADAMARLARQVQQDITAQAARQQQALIGTALGTRAQAPQFIEPGPGAAESILRALGPAGIQFATGGTGNVLQDLLSAAQSRQQGPFPAPSAGGGLPFGFRG